MIITDVKKQINNKNKVSIFVDGEYYNSLFDEIFANSKLTIGGTINEDEFQELKTISEGKLAFNKSLSFLAHRMRAEDEVKNYLVKKEYCHEAIEYAIEKLYKYKYLDDLTFARTLTKDRMNIKLKGKQYIVSELKKFKVDSEIINTIDEEFNYDLEYKNSLKLIKKLNKKYNKIEDEYKKRQKISSSMARMGYNWDTIKSAINEFNEKKNF